MLVRQLPEKQVGMASLIPTFLLTHKSDRIFRAERVCPFQEILGSCWNGRKNQNSEVWGGPRILGKDQGRSAPSCTSAPAVITHWDVPWHVLLLQLLCLPNLGEVPSQPPLRGGAVPGGGVAPGMGDRRTSVGLGPPSSSPSTPGLHRGPENP